MKWFKLWAEIKDDPKMLMLSDHQFRLWINLLALASESKERGRIPPYPPRGLAAALRTTIEDLHDAVTTFAELGMISTTDSGEIVVTHWIDRQYDKPSDAPEAVRQRVAAHRARQRSEDDPPADTEPHTPSSNGRVTQAICNADVTPSNAIDKNRSEENRGEIPAHAHTHEAPPNPPADSDGFDELTSARQLREERAALAKAAPRPIPCPAPGAWPQAATVELKAHARQYPQIAPERTLEWFFRKHERQPPRLLTEWVAAAKAALDSDAAAWAPHPGAAAKNGRQSSPIPIVRSWDAQ